MFNSIVKSVLNEITATDAYNKYYSSIPQEEFFALTRLYGNTGDMSDGKFDNLMKFVMNDLKAGNCTFQDAEGLIKKYISAKQNIKNNFLNLLKTEAIESVEEASIELEVMEMSLLSENELIKKGLVLIYEDEKVKITCTTNYASNHHYFGDTHWCTASDRNGTYDGWKMFLRYTVYNPEYNDIKACLFQCEEKQINEKYQIQFYVNGKLGLVCNSLDDEVLDYPDEDVEEKLLACIEKCAELTCENLAEENKKIEYEETIVDKKNNVVRKKNKKKFDILLSRATELNKKKCDFIDRQFETALETNLFDNYDFISEIISMSKKFEALNPIYFKENLSEYEKFLSTHGYAYANHKTH